MQTEAIAKLRAEMEAARDNEYIQYIGEVLVGFIDQNPDTAEKFIAEDKTIANNLAAMRDEAKKKQKNGMAMLSPVEGMRIVLKYFGVESAPTVPNPLAELSAATPKTEAAPATTPETPKPVTSTPQKTARFSASLDDLL
ncbi:hypothetical protein [Tumebacillus flagellatus]|uniref:Uncharacterized protein n=1 Tax=Tumebacillus flagellatus TaxID=1157490 RepID=A0A074LV05_9BACL|nr:hypothetical protein [Tumebacillus flagellatus]KEO84779.1 hypothetical protein EL26_01850 [Tumebacillus flagellatus]